MTITNRVQQQFFLNSPATTTNNRPKVVRLPLTIVVKYDIEDKASRAIPPTMEQPTPKPKARRTNLWSVEEHNRFLYGLEGTARVRIGSDCMWKYIASVVGTKTTRQTMTHAQKYRQKIERNLKTYESVPGSPNTDKAEGTTSCESSPRVPVLERPPPLWTHDTRIAQIYGGMRFD